MSKHKFKFKVGTIVVTRGIDEKMKSSEIFKDFVIRSLARHIDCDWGDLCEEDKESNDEALKNGDARLFSSYIYGSDKEKIWIITEWDRSVTTILFPEEY